MKNLKFLMAIILASVWYSSHAVDYLNFWIALNNEATASVPLADGGRIYFGADSVTYQDATNRVALVYSDAVYITFSDTPQTSVEAIIADAAKGYILYNEDLRRIEVVSAQPVQAITLVGLSGQTQSVKDSNYMPVGNISSGVYAVQAVCANGVITAKLLIK